MAETKRLLNARTPKVYRGFESSRVHHFLIFSARKVQILDLYCKGKRESSHFLFLHFAILLLK